MFLVDGSNHAFRVQFALPPQHASDGFPTRVLYGFTMLFQKMMRTYAPDYCAVSFDSGRTFRHDRYPEYKANRSEMPEDMRRQWEWLPPLVDAFGYTCVQAEGFEADDVLGTLARRFASPDLHVFLVTGDKDFCQLLGPHVFLVDDAKGAEIGVADVPEKLGVHPDQVVDMLGLAGDSSDNIPGIPGIGQKTAAKLLADFGSLEGVLEAAAAGRIAGKRGESLVEHAGAARLSRELATIKTDVALDVDLASLVPRGVQARPLRDLFDRWEFGKVARKLLPELSALNTARCRSITDEAGLEEVGARLGSGARVGFALRTSHAHPDRGDVVGVSFAWEDDEGAYIPLQPRGEISFDVERARARVFAWLADPSVPKVGHEVKRAMRILRRVGSGLAGIAGDAELLDYVMAAHRRDHSLATLADMHLAHTLSPVPDHEPLMLSELIPGAVERALVARVTHERMERRLEAGLASVYRDLELPLQPVLCAMEEAGIKLDLEVLAAIRSDILGKAAEAEARCHRLAGRPFNVASTKEVAAVLFTELELTASKKTKTGFSTDSSVLEGLAEEHELPAAILEWRHFSGLDATTLAKLPAYVGRDGRIHTTFNQAVAATGRLSSEDPNLQAVPVRSYEGRRIRDGFVAEPGHVFVSADYSQVELRVLAHFCGGGALAESFTRGEDIHRRTASEVWGIPQAEVSVDQRSAAKAINFGLLYGMSAFRLGRDLAISREQAQKYMDEYFERIPQVQAWIEETKASCRERGFVETLYGRRRLIPDIYAKNYSERGAGEREAVNTRVQGTAADIVKRAMVRVHRALEASSTRGRLLLQVHDELLVECPEESAAEVQTLVRFQMESAAELNVPLAVNSGIGRSWNEAHG